MAPLLALGLVVSGCGLGAKPDGRRVVISGSSTVEPISTRVAEQFEDVVAEIEVTVDGPGTGDGFKLFCAGETDISGASRAIKESEIEDCAANDIPFIELPVAFDGIALLAHPENPVSCVSFADLYALMSAEAEGIESWDAAEPLAKELGSATELPGLKLEISGPGTESGTYDSFIELVLEDIAEERGQDRVVRTDFAGQAEDNVIIQGISGSVGGFGWVGYAFADENRDLVKILQVDDGEHGCVAPTVSTIADGSYPVSRTLYIYVNAEKAASSPGLVSYVDFYLSDGYTEGVTRAFGDTGYVELPADLLAEVRRRWSSRTTGVGHADG